VTTNAFRQSAASAPPAARLSTRAPAGDYRLGAPLWPLRIADALPRDRPAGAATLSSSTRGSPSTPRCAIRCRRHARRRRAPRASPPRRTLAAGLTGEVLWNRDRGVDGSLVRDLMAKKRQTGGAGLGARATGNLITGGSVAKHGALGARFGRGQPQPARPRDRTSALGRAARRVVNAGLSARRLRSRRRWPTRRRWGRRNAR